MLQRLKVIYIYLKFHEIRFRGYLVRAYSMDLKSIQGLLLITTKTSLTKLDVHQCLIVIYLYIKFNEIQFRGYLVIADYMDFKSIQVL